MSWRGWQSGKSWWNGKLGRSGAARCVRVRGRFRPGLLELEDRRLPSTFMVSSTADDGVFGHPAGGPSSRPTTPRDSVIIDFSPTVFSTPQTITLSQGPLVLSSGITVTIVGPGAGLLTVTANDAERGVPGQPGGDGDDLRADDRRRQGDHGRRPVREGERDAHRLHDQRQLRHRLWRGSVRHRHADPDRLHDQRQLRLPGRRRVRRRHGHDDRLHDQRQLRRPERRRRVYQRHGHDDRLHDQRQLGREVRRRPVSSTWARRA